MADWYFVGADGQVGPKSEAELRALIASGEVLPQTPVWTAGMENWSPLSEVQLPPEVLAAAPLRMAPSPATPSAPARYAGQVTEEPGRHQNCHQCKAAFPEKVMQPFGSGWICARCKFKMVESAKARGQRRADFGFEWAAFVRHLVFIIFCLGTGSAVIAFKWKNYDALLDYRTGIRSGVQGKGVAALFDGPEMSAIYLVDFTEKPMFAFLDGVPFHLVEIDGEAFAFTVVPTDSPFVFDLATTALKLKTSGQPDPITTSGMARKTIDIPALEQSRDIVLCRVVTPRAALKTPVPQVLTGAMKQGDIFWTLVLEKTRTPIALMGSSTGEITLPPLAPHVPPMVIYTGIIMGNHSPEPLVGAPAYDESGKLVAISMGAESGDGALAIWFEKGDALISLARSKSEE